MIDKDYLERQLYWFLTREPSVKMVVVAVIFGALLFACMICYSSASVMFSSQRSGAQSQSTIPTRAEQAQLPPTYTPQSSQIQQQSAVAESNRLPSNTSGFSTHTNINSLARSVVGSALKSGTLYAESYTQDIDGNPFPGDRTGYDIDLVLNAPNSRTREEILLLAYELMHEFYYNFQDTRPMYLSIHLRASEDVGFGGCVLGIGIGYQAASTYLPKENPSNLEAWFGALRSARYYGDLPGQSDAFLAYGNDPADFTNCGLSNWKR